MSVVGVIGLGSWGTALAHHLASIGHTVKGWSANESIVSSINRDHSNSKYLAGLPLHPLLSATKELSELCEVDFFLIALPSVALREVVPTLSLSSEAVVVSATKGLDEDRLLTPLQLLKELAPQLSRIGVISGPCFAGELVKLRPAGLAAASHDNSVAEGIARLFSGDWIKVYTSHDPLGVELGGILKNVVAIAAGIADGLEFGESARAGLITRGLAEIIRLAKAMGADPMTFAGLSGLGDLVMTSTSDLSRNRRVGVLLGKGHTLPQILSEIGSVAEGVRTAPLAVRLAEKFGVEMPISSAIHDLLQGRVTAHEAARRLISRPLRAEQS